MRVLRMDNPRPIPRATCAADLSGQAYEGIRWLIIQSWGAVGVNEAADQCFVHCQIWDWNRDHRRAAMSHWGTFLALVRSKGYRRLYAVCEENDKTGYKFRRMFGFTDLVAARNGLVLFTQEI